MRCIAGTGSGGSSSALQGAADLGNIVNIHFRCPELAALLRVNSNSSSTSNSSSSKSRAAMLYFVYSARGVCVMVAHNIEQGEWACQVPYFPPFESKEVSEALVLLHCNSSRCKILMAVAVLLYMLLQLLRLQLQPLSGTMAVVLLAC
jgi:hypothetical protein